MPCNLVRKTQRAIESTQQFSNKKGNKITFFNVRKHDKQTTFHMKEQKVKNNLNIHLDDIKSAFKIINENNKLPIQKTNQINLFSSIEKSQQKEEPNNIGNEISSQTLKYLIDEIYGTQFDTSLIVQGTSQKERQLTTGEIHNFINFNEFDNFDPLKEAYNCLLDEYGKFSLKKYNEINQLMNFPQIQDSEQFQQALGIRQNEQITFQKFKQIIENGKDLYLND